MELRTAITAHRRCRPVGRGGSRRILRVRRRLQPAAYLLRTVLRLGKAGCSKAACCPDAWAAGGLQYTSGLLYPFPAQQCQPSPLRHYYDTASHVRNFLRLRLTVVLPQYGSFRECHSLAYHGVSGGTSWLALQHSACSFDTMAYNAVSPRLQ